MIMRQNWIFVAYLRFQHLMNANESSSADEKWAREDTIRKYWTISFFASDLLWLIVNVLKARKLKKL